MIPVGTLCWFRHDEKLLSVTYAPSIVDVAGPEFYDRCFLLICNESHPWYPCKANAGRIVHIRSHCLVPITPPGAEQSSADAKPELVAA